MAGVHLHIEASVSMHIQSPQGIVGLVFPKFCLPSLLVPSRESRKGTLGHQAWMPADPAPCQPHRAFKNLFSTDKMKSTTSFCNAKNQNSVDSGKM